MKLAESEAYYAGVQAFKDGKNVGSNPYAKWSIQSKDWLSGYHTRRMEQSINDYRLMDITNDEAKFQRDVTVPNTKRSPHYYYGYGARWQNLDHGHPYTIPHSEDVGYADWIHGFHDATKAWKEEKEGK